VDLAPIVCQRSPRPRGVGDARAERTRTLPNRSDEDTLLQRSESRSYSSKHGVGGCRRLTPPSPCRHRMQIGVSCFRSKWSISPSFVAVSS